MCRSEAEIQAVLDEGHRRHVEGRAYYDGKKGDGKAPMEATRCVKRRLSDIVFQTMLNDAVRTTEPPRGVRVPGSGCFYDVSSGHRVHLGLSCGRRLGAFGRSRVR